MRKPMVVLLAVLALSLGGCGYNDFQSGDEQVKASWSEVVNQYQRRADLVPNLVATVKGEANFEQETLTKVIEARAKATSIQATPELINDPAAFTKFQQAQGELSGALGRLLVVAEAYPQLKSDETFKQLQGRIIALEESIADRRELYNDQVNLNNIRVKVFPDVIIAQKFGFLAAQLLEFADEEKRDVNVNALFGT